ncbi:hypothetical protein ACN38_g1374 [Penicillium nordicum]|uniref:Uncharacterized protein n=1 Tax=Penicillium nordicum TaxID=229535 RepID=A0A0M9WJX1_9EURO|nr:hypothetical protein ACN38_g1374 [Penicillium nordicum]
MQGLMQHATPGECDKISIDLYLSGDFYVIVCILSLGYPSISSIPFVFNIFFVCTRDISRWPRPRTPVISPGTWTAAYTATVYHCGYF